MNHLPELIAATRAIEPLVQQYEEKVAALREAEEALRVARVRLHDAYRDTFKEPTR